MSKKTEVISKGKKSILMDLSFSAVVKVDEIPSVLPYQSMNISHKIICIPVQLVVKIISALIRTKFLISATTDSGSAVETFFFHSTKVLIKI